MGNKNGIWIEQPKEMKKVMKFDGMTNVINASECGTQLMDDKQCRPSSFHIDNLSDFDISNVSIHVSHFPSWLPIWFCVFAVPKWNCARFLYNAKAYPFGWTTEHIQMLNNVLLFQKHTSTMVAAITEIRKCFSIWLFVSSWRLIATTYDNLNANSLQIALKIYNNRINLVGSCYAFIWFCCCCSCFDFAI